MQHLVHTKEQMEYVRIAKEYEFVKKRALVNFLEKSRGELEVHMHGRATNMLSAIAGFENKNLKDLMTGIGEGAFSKVTAAMNDPAQRKVIMASSFESALSGIRAGVMTYENDPLMPILVNEVNARTSAFANLTSAEEGKMLSLTADQKRMVGDNDRRAKEEFLKKLPAISNPSIRMHPKYQAYAAAQGGAAH